MGLVLMTETSINGWPASENQETIGVKSFKIPGSVRKVRVAADAAPILLWVSAQFHAKVQSLDPDPLAVWGYKYRKALQGNGKLSDHASGTAVDLRSDKFPVGTRHMKPWQVLRVRLILAQCNKLIIWGGDYNALTSKDQMHFAIAPGVTAKQIQAWRVKKRISAEGVPLP
ncbi:M15 family peptidase [bacterium]|nr:M15 family peptidase [bacterium]